MMAEMFCGVLNRSITVSIVIGIVLLVRLLFSRLPKIFSYVLWLAVLIRLLCPVVPKADFGFVPGGDRIEFSLAQTGEMAREEAVFIPDEIKGLKDGTAGESESAIRGTDTNTAITHLYEADTNQINNGMFVLKLSQKSAWGMASIWLAVAGTLLLYEMISYLRFMHCLKPGGKEAVIISPKVSEPFVAGIFRPVIYLPEGLDKKKQELVIIHEQIHIRRLDYLIKPIFLFTCCVYWFHPLIWIAYYLMIRDMESSCDEAVIQRIGYNRKKEYAFALLGFSSRREFGIGYPTAFGENHVKRRIENVIKTEKKSAWLLGTAALITGIIIVLLVIDRTDAGQKQMLPAEEILTEEVQMLPAEEILTEEVQMLPAEDIIVQDEGINEVQHEYKETEMHEYHGNGDTEVQMLPAEDMIVQEETEDQFAVLLTDSPGSYNDLGIAYLPPVENVVITNGYGTRIHPVTGEEKVHSGVDFSAQEGTPVMAAADGLVLKTGFESNCGNYVIIEHMNGELTYYACCQEILAREGAEVKRGEEIAMVGKTGTSTGAHLHFAVSKNSEFIAPVFTSM